MRPIRIRQETVRRGLTLAPQRPSTLRPTETVTTTRPAFGPVVMVLTITRRPMCPTRSRESSFVLTAVTGAATAGAGSGAGSAAGAAVTAISTRALTVGADVLLAHTVRVPPAGGSAGATSRPLGDIVPALVLQVTPPDVPETAADNCALVPAIRLAGAFEIDTDGAAAVIDTDAWGSEPASGKGEVESWATYVNESGPV